MQLELEVARGDRRTGIRLGQAVIGAVVPDGLVVVLLRRMLELVVVDLDRQSLDLRVQRRLLGHRPRREYAVDLEAQVIVQGGRLVQLDDEDHGQKR